MRTTESNERIARRVAEEIATGRNLDLIPEVYDEGAVEHGLMGQEFSGHEAIRTQMRAVLDGFSDFEAVVEDAVAEGDTVAMRVTLRGTHDGPFMGIEPTGKRVEVDNMVFTRVEDGKIVERWIYPDMLGLLVQIGAVELPPELGEGADSRGTRSTA